MSQAFERIGTAIIGAGFSGLAMARGLERAGRDDFLVLEKASAVGGTWRDNRYPGAGCDVPSLLYALSDAPNPDWSRLFCGQAEIQAYLEALAAPLRARQRLRTGWALSAARWDARAAAWRLEAADGRALVAENLVLAVGGLHHPAWADIPGREDYAGLCWHTACWPEQAEIDGRRVAVIGTGASAIQLVPRLAGRVERLYVLQRTPPWLLPKPDLRIPPWLRRLFRRLPPVRLSARAATFLALESLSAGLLWPRTAFWARWLARLQLRLQVKDAALRQRLRPDYPIGCKRVLLSSDYYPALQQPGVELVDTPIRCYGPRGLVLADGRELEVELIVHATGFRPMDLLREIRITGRDGIALAEAWSPRPTAHLGIGVPGFPNLFLLLGPNTALGHNSVLYMIETQVRHVLSALNLKAREAVRAIEPTEAALARFLTDVERGFRGSAWAGGCRSWYLDGQGRNIALWTGPALAYRRRAARARREDYRVFG